MAGYTDYVTESIGIMEDPVADIVEESFPSQLRYQGRYKVGLPWKSTRPESTNSDLCVVHF